ncbi:MAG: c-type cytochrome biogenesis protein CcmI [Mesorhizobium sp.]|nr:c-type cytochrome biogenesis protein CcmI [Mesorhizobium sp.]
MLFWIIAAALTLGACMAVLAPFSRRREEASRDEDHDLEVYRDQLSELERDAARGLIAPAEAEQARAEIGRRILKVDAERQQRPARGQGSSFTRYASLTAVLAVPLLSWGIYAGIGSPGMPGQPLEARLAQDSGEASMAQLVALAEAHLSENPEDVRGWEVLGPVYIQMGRGGDAVVAYRNAIRLDGETAMRQIGLGEALVATAGGTVTFEAQQAFEQALVLEPDNVRARFFLASGYMQDGRSQDAVSIWQSLAAELPADSLWRGAVDEALRDAGVEAAVGPGPLAEDIEAAAGLEEEDRTAMIEDMVAGLDARLRSEPDDPQGWQRLVRSYVVLGRQDDARDALDRGLDALGRESTQSQELATFALALGIAPTELER